MGRLVFLQTSNTSRTRPRCSATSARSLAPSGAVYVSTPNLLTPRRRAREVDNRGTSRIRAEEFRALWESVIRRRRGACLFHARKLRVHEVRAEARLDEVHKRLGSAERSRPLHARDLASDFASARKPRGPGAGVRTASGAAPGARNRATSTERSTPRRCVAAEAQRAPRELALVLTPTCLTWRAMGRGRFGRSGCGSDRPPDICRCSTCWTRPDHAVADPVLCDSSAPGRSNLRGILRQDSARVPPWTSRVPRTSARQRDLIGELERSAAEYAAGRDASNRIGGGLLGAWEPRDLTSRRPTRSCAARDRRGRLGPGADRIASHRRRFGNWVAAVASECAHASWLHQLLERRGSAHLRRAHAPFGLGPGSTSPRS